MKKLLIILTCLLTIFVPFSSSHVIAKEHLSVAHNYETFDFKIKDLQKWINNNNSSCFKNKKYVFKKDSSDSKKIKLKSGIYLYAYFDKQNKNKVYTIEIKDKKNNQKNESYIKEVSKLFINEFGADNADQVILQAEDTSRDCDDNKEQGIYIFNHVNYKIIFDKNGAYINDFSTSKFNMDQDYRNSYDYISFCESLSKSNNENQQASNSTETQDHNHIYSNADTAPIKSSSGSVLGEYSIVHANSSECTDDNLLDWYLNYVKTHNTYQYHIILYADNPGYGVYSANGIIQKDVAMSLSNGSYGIIDTSSCTTYSVTENNTLVTIQ